MISVEKPGTPEELVHFGIKGMKWGVRRERDGSGGGSKNPIKKFKELRAKRKERRLKEVKSDISKGEGKIKELKANPGTNPIGKLYRAARVKKIEGYLKQKREDHDDILHNRLTDKQRNVLIGAAVVGTVLAAHGAFKFKDSGTLHAWQTRNIPLKKNDLLKGPMSAEKLMDDVIAPVNDGYGIQPGAMMNCRRCTLSTEMRRRGYDVKATKAVLGTGQTHSGLINAIDPNSDLKTGFISQGFNWGKDRLLNRQTPLREGMEQTQGMGRVKVPGIIHHPPSARDIRPRLDADVDESITNKVFEAISIHPPNSRGELGLKWHGRGAHSVYWEMIGNKPHIFDAQSGEEYTHAHFATQIAPRLQSAATTRLDNKPLNDNFLRRWVTNTSQADYDKLDRVRQTLADTDPLRDMFKSSAERTRQGQNDLIEQWRKAGLLVEEDLEDVD